MEAWGTKDCNFSARPSGNARRELHPFGYVSTQGNPQMGFFLVVPFTHKTPI